MAPRHDAQNRGTLLRCHLTEVLGRKVINSGICHDHLTMWASTRTRFKIANAYF